MATRSYTNTLRADAAAEKRGNSIAAAAQLFRDGATAATFSLDAVAKASGVTRLTVYKQFGSRAGLLEAVFDDLAERGGILRLAALRGAGDPAQALDRLVEIFCAFWSGDAALARLYDAMAVDVEIAAALDARIARGREVIAHIVAQIAGAGGARAQERRDAVDLIFTLTGLPAYRTLAHSRNVDQVCALLKRSCADVAGRLRARF